ncbi:MAG: hypothetical protein PVG22_13845 [Chromatiales bacterium]|jgi:hypothetical protein
MSSDHCLETGYESLPSTRHVVLQMGRLALLIPHHQAHTFEPTMDVIRSQDEGVGWFSLDGTRSPVYCLSEDLQPITEVPADRRICVLLNTDAEIFGLLCTHVGLFEQIKPDIQPVPECMRVPKLPVRGLVTQGEEVLYVTSAQDLLSCLDQAV